jgi:hypothetical protein
MGWFSRKPTPEKQIDAVIKIGTNLYLHTVPEAEDAPAPLQFCLPDSRYRYLIFCLTTATNAILAYDEKKNFQPEVLYKGCLHFATWAATATPQDYFSEPISHQDVSNVAMPFFTKFLKLWAEWPNLENAGKNSEINDLICSMIHSTESNAPADKSDLHRIGPLALWIDCRMPTMFGAFTELIKK